MTDVDVIETAYANARHVFRSHVANLTGARTAQVIRKRVPPIHKKDPVTGKPSKIRWEPEDSVCFSDVKGLYRFPGMIKALPGMFVAPAMGLNFQTATLALVPKKPNSPLHRYMARMRWDAVPNPDAVMDWEKRRIRDVTFGIKDAGKGIDRMELQTGNKETCACTTR